MIHKFQSPFPGHVRVVFELPASIWADRISLIGDFNDWRENDIMLKQARSGAWQAILDIPLGAHYEFRYVIDGQWRTDSHCDGTSENRFGSLNSIVDATLPEGLPVLETALEIAGMIPDNQLLRTISAMPAALLLPRSRTPVPSQIYSAT
jgi:hypothetical protein